MSAMFCPSAATSLSSSDLSSQYNPLPRKVRSGALLSQAVAVYNVIAVGYPVSVFPLNGGCGVEHSRSGAKAGRSAYGATMPNRVNRYGPGREAKRAQA